MQSSEGPEREFVAAQLRLAADGFGSGLTDRLARRRFGEPISLVAVSDAVAHQDLGSGGLASSSRAVMRTVACIEGWLRAAPVGRWRVLLADEVMVDGAAMPSGFHARYVRYGEGRLAWLASSEGEPGEVLAALESQYEYPGVSVLAEVDWLPQNGQLLGETELDAVVRGAVAIAVWAWDGEAHLIAECEPDSPNGCPSWLTPDH